MTQEAGHTVTQSLFILFPEGSMETFFKEPPDIGTSLVDQWLRFHLPLQGVRVQSLVGVLRSHMPL